MNINISPDNLIKVLSIIASLLASFLVAKYNSNTPRKINIKQQQFDKVYLPSYKLTLTIKSSNLLKDDYMKYLKQLKFITWNNYEFVYPTLHILIKNFENNLNKDIKESYLADFEQIVYNIEITYLKLRKTLNYPYESNFNIFKYMSAKDIFKEILGWVNVILILNPVFLGIFSFIPYINNNFLNLMFYNYCIFFIIIIFEVNFNTSPNVHIKKKK